jgi:GT2 family glycosyltransferase
VLPDSSLILASRDRPDLLADAVTSILAGGIMPTELLVIDQSRAPNAFVTGLAEQNTANCAVRYLRTTTRGLSRANNLGIRQAQYPVLAFTHDDIVAAPEWYGELIAALTAGGRQTVVTGQVLPLQIHGGGIVPTTKVDPTPRVYSGRIAEDVLYPLNMALYRSAFDDIGCFDERLGPGTPFPAAEDNDLGLRLLRAGYQIRYVPEPIVYHRDWRSEDQLWSLRWSYGRGQGAYYAKHLSIRDGHMTRRMLGDVFRHVWQGVCRARKQHHLALGDGAYTLGLLAGSAQWLLTYQLAGH